jgi:hypothetical protein
VLTCHLMAFALQESQHAYHNCSCCYLETMTHCDIDTAGCLGLKLPCCWLSMLLITAPTHRHCDLLLVAAGAAGCC